MMLFLLICTPLVFLANAHLRSELISTPLVEEDISSTLKYKDTNQTDVNHTNMSFRPSACAESMASQDVFSGYADDLSEFTKISYRNHTLLVPENLHYVSNETRAIFDRDFEKFQRSISTSNEVAVRKSRNGKPAVFFHIHKYGGTSMCVLARANGEQAGKCNCNLCEDSCKYSPASSVDASKYEAAMTPNAPVSYVQIERDLRPHDMEEFGSKFTTAVTLRDPMIGLLANMAMHKIDPVELANAMRGNFSIAGIHKRMNGCLKHEVSGQLVQSFATRSLSGNFNVPMTTDKDLENAKKNLDKFDVVLTLEAFNNHRLDEVFGWNPAIRLTRAKAERTPEGAKMKIRQRLEDCGAWETLQDMNKHDIQLYKYARAKYAGNFKEE